MSDQLSLFGDPQPVDPIEPVAVPAPVDTPSDPDVQARAYAVDPRHNVVLEASAGTGKTSVLVHRYVNLLKAGVDPANILAITFTRKAAAEMRERIVRELRESAERSEFDKARWVELRDRLGDIAISTIDAFCLSLLREFPLEADLDPGFDMADETEVPRLMEESLDRSMRVLTGMATTDADVALVLAQLGISRTREGLASLLDRRLVAWDALNRFLVRGPADLTAEVICRRAATSLQDVLRTVPGGLAAFLADGPVRHPRYPLLLREIERLGDVQAAPDAVIRGVLDRIAGHFLTNEGKARRSGQIYPYKAQDYSSPDAAKRHRAALFQVAPAVERVVYAFNRDLNVVLARGIRKMFTIALEQYRRALEERSVLDFSDVLQRALQLLRQMDEFAQSRFRLEARYHHVLVDEFQDTSRAQWELVALLIQSWGEGLGLATQPSIFIVGDRKQSIYRFRDAEVAVLQQAARFIEGLRPEGSPRRSITRSFRAVPGLLQFVNDVFEEVAAEPATRPDDFSYGDGDRFPVDLTPETGRGLMLGIAAAEPAEACAAAVADEIVRILKEEDVRDKKTGVPRRTTPGDIAILFRSRSSHREFEHELEARGIPTYVYKGLGFFDADETKDVLALIRFLADPGSHLRAAALLRSRFIRISDSGLAALAPDLAAAVTTETAHDARLNADDRRVLEHARPRVQRWLALADRVPPADLVEQILRESAYAYELRGPRRMQAWENLKKMRSLVRRIQNRGYATLRRIADHIDALTAGDESNAVIEALDAVNLMTVHASKGLEFPIVFVVNMAKGASGPPKPVRVIVNGDEEPSVSIGPFVSDMDDMDRVRERHESRRLLYVALTRARDRLYLSSALKKGAVAAGRGSLAEVLPESICGLFARAASAFPEAPTVAWTSSAGRTFEFRICRPAGDTAKHVGSAAEGRPGLFVPPTGVAPLRRAVTQMVRPRPPAEVRSHGASVGMLVHRLIRQPNILEQRPEQQERVAREWVRRQIDSSTDSEAVVQAALAVIRRPETQDRMLALLGSGEPFFEVPFSFAHQGGVVRGSIDCLIRSAGRIQVVEFKTGGSAPEHGIQRDLYVQAARSMFPDVHVEGHLIYL
jgi:ATP-dependent helicase/nuclease subunit A